MKLLVTGGTGMLGRTIIERYQGLYDIRFTGRNIKLGHVIAKQTGAEFIAADLDQLDQLKIACEGVEAVIHCAARSSPWGTEAEFEKINVVGTKNLLKCAQQAAIKRFVYISSPSVYFNYQDELDIAETKPLGPVFCNHYAKSKAKAEKLVISSSLHSTLLRPRGIIGPYDQSILPRIINKIDRSRFWLPTYRDPKIDITYVDNVVDAAILALKSDTPAGVIYNITNGEPMNVSQILAMLFNALNQSVTIKRLPYQGVSWLVRCIEAAHRILPNTPEPKFTRYSLALLHFNITLDISKARGELGYVPSVSLEEGIKRYVQWYQGSLV